MTVKTLMLRFPTEIEPRILALLERVRTDDEFAAVQVSKSAVLRMALLLGIEQLERRYRRV